MANRPANAGSGRGAASAGDPLRGDTAPPLDPVAPPPPVHHQDAVLLQDAGHLQDMPRAATGPRPAAGHRAARTSRTFRATRGSRGKGEEEPVDSGPAWIPYLIVLAGAALGMYIAWQGSKYAIAGIVVLGCSLLVAALARLLLPARLVGLLSSRRKAFDVLVFTVLGTGVLAVALSLP